MNRHWAACVFASLGVLVLACGGSEFTQAPDSELDGSADVKKPDATVEEIVRRALAR